jgi:hypothetical protein
VDREDHAPTEARRYFQGEKMKHPIVIDGPYFDWERGKKAMDTVVTESGEVKWGAAMMADPGVTKCPACGAFFWKEAKIIKCSECGTSWNTENNQEIQQTSC